MTIRAQRPAWSGARFKAAFPRILFYPVIALSTILALGYFLSQAQGPNVKRPSAKVAPLGSETVPDGPPLNAEIGTPQEEHENGICGMGRSLSQGLRRDRILVEPNAGIQNQQLKILTFCQSL
jgi:hypothetical protein